MCRSRRELSNAYLLAKFGFDTAENGPCQVCPIELTIKVADDRFSPESTRADLRVITQPDLAQKVGFDVAVIVFSRLKQFLSVQNEGVDELLVNT